MHLSLIRSILIFACCVATFFLLQNVTGVRSTPILQPLNVFPEMVGPYKVQASRSSSQEVINMLGVDDYIDYSYLAPSGTPLNLYLAYYESVGVNGGYHSPKNCLPGGGWGINSVELVRISSGKNNGKQVSVTEMIIRNQDAYQIVLYWYQNRGRTIASEYWEKVFLVLDALFKGRRDGSFVRIITEVPEGKMEETKREARKFAGLVLEELDNFIPGEG